MPGVLVPVARKTQKSSSSSFPLGWLQGTGRVAQEATVWQVQPFLSKIFLMICFLLI